MRNSTYNPKADEIFKHRFGNNKYKTSDNVVCLYVCVSCVHVQQTSGELELVNTAEDNKYCVVDRSIARTCVRIGVKFSYSRNGRTSTQTKHGRNG